MPPVHQCLFEGNIVLLMGGRKEKHASCPKGPLDFAEKRFKEEAERTTQEWSYEFLKTKDSIPLNDQVGHRAVLVWHPKDYKLWKQLEVVLRIDITLMTGIIVKHVSDRNQGSQRKREKRGYVLWSLPLTHWFINISSGFLEVTGGHFGEDTEVLLLLMLVLFS